MSKRRSYRFHWFKEDDGFLSKILWIVRGYSFALSVIIGTTIFFSGKYFGQFIFVLSVFIANEILIKIVDIIVQKFGLDRRYH